MARILLIEDTEEVWDFLSRRLARRGYDVLLAHDGKSGVEMARTDVPDVILLDMNLPVLDGWSVARQLKSEPATAAIPIIAMTAHALVSDREKAIAAGCDDYHSKPIDFANLLSQISKALEDRSKPSVA